jgi:ABC-type dipeptide/oligopeptide/nickel transport system ATPase component
MRQVRGREIGIVFQEPMTSLNPVLTVGTQLAEAIRRRPGLRRAAVRERAVELLVEVGLPDPQQRLASYPHQLSGGMRQRVLIAIALAARPSLLIADEPTTALDVTVQAQILDLLRRLAAQRGMAMVFISHDLRVIAEVADRVLVMAAGQAVEQAGVEALFARPQHQATRGLLALVPGGAQHG